MEKKVRVRYVDIFKSVGIIFMIMGHTSMCPQILSKWFTCFYMPMFFWISGYFFHCDSFWKYIDRKARKMLIPYFGVSFFSLLVFYYMVALPQNISLKPYIRAILFESYSQTFPISGALWFLLALFWAEVFFVIMKKTNSKTVLLFGSIILGVVGTQFGHFTTYRLPWNIDSAMVGESFMYIGYLCKQWKDNKIMIKLFDLPWYLLLPGLVLNYFCAIQNGVSMWGNYYKNVPLFYFNACVGIVLVYNVAKKIDYSKSIIMQKAAAMMNFIGFHSIVYLCMNQLVLFGEKRIMILHYGWPQGKDIYFFWIFLTITSILIMSGMAAVLTICKKGLSNLTTGNK